MGDINVHIIGIKILCTRAVQFQIFHLGSGFFGTEKPRFGSVSVIFEKEEQ
jgi:hypothetical protein